MASAGSVWPLGSFTFEMAQSIKMVPVIAHAQVPISCLSGPVSDLFQCRTRLCWLVVRLLRLPSGFLLKCQFSHLALGHRAISLSLNTYPNRRRQLVPCIWHRCCGPSCQTLLQQRIGLCCSLGRHSTAAALAWREAP